MHFFRSHGNIYIPNQEDPIATTQELTRTLQLHLSLQILPFLPSIIFWGVQYQIKLITVISHYIPSLSYAIADKMGQLILLIGGTLW